MSVRRRFLAVIVFTILVMGSVSAVFTVFTMLSLSKEIGDRVIIEKVELVNSALDREIDEIDKICKDWAYWDDTYEFILSRNQEYIKSNLVNETFIDIEMNYIIFLDRQKKVVWAGAYDWKNGTSMEIPEELYEFIKSIDSEFKGIVDLQSPTFVAVRNILPSEGSDEARGWLIFARKVYDEQISALVGFPVQIVSPRFTALSYFYSDNVTVFLPVKDIWGNTVANAVFSVYPFWLELSSNSIKIVLISVVITASVLTFAIFAMLDRELRRILSVGMFLKELKDFRERISVRGDDEISELAKNINMLLERIERTAQELKTLNDALSLTNKIMRHDIKNKVAAISLFAELGSESGERKYYDRIRQICEDIVRTLSRLRGLEEKEGMRSLKLKEVVEEVMEGYDVEWNWKGGEAAVLADNGIYTVIDNIVHNSITHGKTKRVDFEVTDIGKTVELRIKDYGVGIPEELRDKIFEEGFSASGSTGLGLFIARKLVERYGGKLTFETHKDGAIFVIKLPKG